MIIAQKKKIITDANNCIRNGSERCSEELQAVPKGGKGKGGKGYGQCWERGGMGHPRRECPEFLARMNVKCNEVAALNGSGEKGGGGKGKGYKADKGKWNGKGNQNYNYKYNNYNCKSPGKVVGKGLNMFDADYFNTWGDESSGQWPGGSSNWWSDDWSSGSGMNLMMMLERGLEAKEKDRQATKISGERDPLFGAKRGEPITLLNKLEALQTENDIDDENEELISEHTLEHDTQHVTKHRPNKRQRQRRREQQCHESKYCNHNQFGCQHDDHNPYTTTHPRNYTTTFTARPQHNRELELEERARDAAMMCSAQGEDWTGLENSKLTKPSVAPWRTRSHRANAHNKQSTIGSSVNRHITITTTTITTPNCLPR